MVPRFWWLKKTAPIIPSPFVQYATHKASRALNSAAAVPTLTRLASLGGASFRSRASKVVSDYGRLTAILTSLILIRVTERHWRRPLSPLEEADCYLAAIFCCGSMIRGHKAVLPIMLEAWDIGFQEDVEYLVHAEANVLDDLQQEGWRQYDELLANSEAILPRAITHTLASRLKARSDGAVFPYADRDPFIFGDPLLSASLEAELEGFALVLLSNFKAIVRMAVELSDENDFDLWS